MFLSKKNAIYFNKPKHQDPTKPKRILGGIYIDKKRLARRLVIKGWQDWLQQKGVSQA